MTRAARYRLLRNARRISQGIFLALSVYLLLRTSIDTLLRPDALPRISDPVGFFLEIDPLVAVATVLSTGELYRNLLWAVPLVIATLLAGRFFCGWICPLGTLNQAISSVRSGKLRGRHRLEANRYRAYQRWKYGILAFFLGAALFGSLQLGLLDPIVLFTRSMTNAILPAWDGGVRRVALWLYAADAGPLSPVPGVVAAATELLELRNRTFQFDGAVLIAALFFAVLLANRFITRLWCRGICPLGALLGVLSRFSLLGLEKSRAQCSDCNLCALDCQGADDPQPGLKWRQSECHLCLNCVADCPEAGIDFRFYPRLADTHRAVDITRRTVVTTTIAGMAAVPLMRASASSEKGQDPALVRPPGAVKEESFLARCIRCGECMNVCPNNALHPTFLQAGFEGLWSPVLIPRIGYCEPTCVLCGQVCPTGAIDEITEREKAWVPVRGQEKTGRPPLRIGTAFYDHGRCLPWAMATECIVCEEWCPTSPKAIYFETMETQTRSGGWIPLKRPHVDPALCVGCGACTFACPVKGAPAIYVTSVGETRNPANSILLGKKKPRALTQ